MIGDWQSEPHQQHQNPAERRYQTIKTMANTIIDRTGSPAYTWLLALIYVCFILNHTASGTIGWRAPLEVLTGSTPDISPLLRFQWWEPVYYKVDDADFPSESRELRGHFVGIAEHVGHAMTYKILTDDTQKVIFRSNVRSALDPMAPNQRLDPLNENPQHIIRSRHDSGDGPIRQVSTPITDVHDLIGRVFTMDSAEDGQEQHVKIVELIEDHNYNTSHDPRHIKFRCSINNDEYEESIAYNDILNYLEKDSNDPVVWNFKQLTGHEGPLISSHPNWKGSKYNVMVEWENGEITSEPLTAIAKDDPVSCAIYARDHNLLDTKGWRMFKGLAKRQKNLFQAVNQAKIRTFYNSPKFKYGFEIPRDYKHAIQLDNRNGNTNWQDAVALEMEQLDEYDTFKDYGLNAAPPPDHKRIRVHLVFDVKHDGRHKARLVADGHLTDVPVDSVYSGVVSLRGLRLIIFLAELNNLILWSTDIGNAYLEALTLEMVYIIAGPEFKGREGHTLVVYKALYGLRSSGLRWHERLADCLRDIGFFPCKAENDIWMRKNGDVYEYVGVYVDDLAMAMEDPQAFTDLLADKHKFKLKGTGEIKFHLGCDFFRDEDGTLCMAPHKYIDKILSNYECLFGCKPKGTSWSPLNKGDHPEIDTSDFLDADGIRLYQSLVGSLQWAISLGRFDIATAVMSMSSFRALPRKGHLERLKRIYGYLSRMKHAVLRFRTGEPDYSDLHDFEYNWESVYAPVREDIPHDAPEPLGCCVTFTHYVDANLMHDIVTGRSVTGVLHLINQTPIDWFSKKQATVETATYGSEFVAARTCVEQIIDLRNVIRYLGVPIHSKSYVFGDNKSVVNSSSIPHSKLHKRHTALSFHRVREAVAAKIIGFYFIEGENNPADILSKHWGYQQVWKLLCPLLCWKGETYGPDETGVAQEPTSG